MNSNNEGEEIKRDKLTSDSPCESIELHEQKQKKINQINFLPLSHPVSSPCCLRCEKDRVNGELHGRVIGRHCSGIQRNWSVNLSNVAGRFTRPR